MELHRNAFKFFKSVQPFLKERRQKCRKCQIWLTYLHCLQFLVPNDSECQINMELTNRIFCRKHIYLDNKQITEYDIKFSVVGVYTG